MSETTEIALTDENAVEVVMGEVLPEIEDRDQAARSIVEEIMKAETLGELFRTRKTIASKEMIGIPLRIKDIRLLRSTLPDKPNGVWGLIDAERLDNGESFAMNTGARNLLALLVRGKMQGNLPVECVVTEAGRARPGENAPLTLAPYGKTAEAVQKEISA